METAIVSISTGVMKPLLTKLSELLEEEWVKLKNVRKNIKFLKEELEAMNATFQTLEEFEELNPQTRVWRDKLRELAYDIEDCIDAFMARVGHEKNGPTGFKGLLHKLKKIKPHHEIANEIEKLKKRVSEASEIHSRYNFLQPAHSARTLGTDPRLSALYKMVDIVGINGPKKHIIEWFTSEEEDGNLKVLSIVGCGGLGITTLANKVYHQLNGQFQCKGIVSVSRNYDVRNILRQILVELGIDDNIPYDDRQLIDKIRGHLKDKSDGGYIYEMEALSFPDSKRLFCKNAFGSEELCHPFLEKVCDGLLEKCCGLPLAILTISSMLAGKLVEDEWNRVLSAIGHGLAKNPDAENMIKILSLSFMDLPRHLRSCFLYLSVFPEDHWVEKQGLISRWIAEGFIIEEQGRSAYESGELYFNELANRSLIQPSCGLYYSDEVVGCRVHDIIFDYIKCKATEENFVTFPGIAEHENMSGYKRWRRICSSNRDEVNASTSISPMLCSVRSVTVVGYAMQISLLEFTALRVLDLEDCWALKDSHLANVEQLVHLKYLCLGSISITSLPVDSGRLQYLETLNIRRTRIRKLPSTIIKLTKLTRLYIFRGTRFRME